MTNQEHTHPAHDAIIWTSQQRASLIASVTTSLPNIHTRAVGGPKRAPVGQLADAVGLRSESIYDDLRKMIIDHPAQFLLLGTGTGVTIDALRAAEKQQIQVISLDPPIDDLTALPDATPEPGKGKWWWPLPSWQLSPAWLSAAQPQEELGRIKSLSTVMLGPPESGSLFSRIYDAFDMILTLCGMPNIIDATIISPLSSPPPYLRELTGHFSAMIKLPKGATATIHASDTSVQWTRRTHAIAETGQLYLADTAYQLWNSAGKLVDSLERTTTQPINAVELITAQWQRMIEHNLTTTGPDPRQVLACCQAALLSARTNAQESPDSMLRLAGI